MQKGCMVSMCTALQTLIRNQFTVGSMTDVPMLVPMSCMYT